MLVPEDDPVGGADVDGEPVDAGCALALALEFELLAVWPGNASWGKTKPMSTQVV